ncbi:hypothetical protein [Chlorobium sp. N1]|uniref:hypothetical protein n=1 Tax=Chlorobium sp. N1 TaxID=2491138 RepID=UPI00103D31FA|nr:hypothetical protein [Chlorobium sp. N1]TCD47320.1 hypothetical protein E0L29_08490 [Chlorobium sp. N1]
MSYRAFFLPFPGALFLWLLVCEWFWTAAPLVSAAPISRIAPLRDNGFFEMRYNAAAIGRFVSFCLMAFVVSPLLPPV